MSNLKEIAQALKEAKENIILIYAFNATGKTQLSVEYKEITKTSEGKHTGVYYNAYSEDLFVWDNDENNDNENIKLKIIESSLTQFHKAIEGEGPIQLKLDPYRPKYDFKLNPIEADNPELGWGSISFFLKSAPEKPIKISRSEERIFVWCFFLALFEVDGWANIQNAHFFIDDPVSSLDDHNIFITASLMLDFIENHFSNRKIIITTHHIGLFSVLSDWLSKGEKSSKFKHIVVQENKKVESDKEVVNKKEVEENKFKICFLELEKEEPKLVGRKKGTQLYHLVLVQMLEDAKISGELYVYHFVLLRQILESVSSFLGKGRFSYVLDKIKIQEKKMPDIINTLSHQKIYTPKLTAMSDNEKELFTEVFEKLKVGFPFEI